MVEVPPPKPGLPLGPKRLLGRYWRQIKSDREGVFSLSSLIPDEYLLMTWPGYRPWVGLAPEAFAILDVIESANRMRRRWRRLRVW